MNRYRKAGTWIGLLLVALGAYLPWITENPLTSESELLLYPSGLGSGLEAWGVVTLVLAAVAAVGSFAHVRWIGSPVFRIVVGLLAVGFATEFLVDLSVTGGQYTAGSGVVATIVGGCILVLAHSTLRESFVRSPPPLSAR